MEWRGVPLIVRRTTSSVPQLEKAKFDVPMAIAAQQYHARHDFTSLGCNWVTPIAQATITRIEGAVRVEKMDQVLFYADRLGERRKLLAGGVSYVFKNRTRMQLEGDCLKFIDIVPLGVDCYCTFKLCFQSEMYALMFYRQIKSFIGPRLTTKGCFELTWRRRVIRRLHMGITPIEDWPVEFSFEGHYFLRTTSLTLELEQPLQFVIDPMTWASFGSNLIKTEVIPAILAAEGPTCMHEIPDQFHDDAVAIKNYSDINDLDILNAIRSHRNGGLHRETFSVLLETPFDRPHPLRLGLDSNFQWVSFTARAPVATEKRKLCEYRRAILKKAVETNNRSVLSNVPLCFTNVDAVWGLLVTEIQGSLELMTNCLVSILIFIPTGLLQVKQRGATFLTQALVPTDLENSETSYETRQFLVAITESSCMMAHHELNARWMRMVEMVDDTDDDGLIPHPSNRVYWALALYEAVSECTTRDSNIGDRCKIVARADYVRPTSIPGFPEIYEKATFWANNLGERHIQFADPRFGKPDAANMVNSMPHFKLRYDFDIATRMKLEGDVIAFYNVSADITPDDPKMFRHLWIKFLNNQEALVFFRRVKGYMGERRKNEKPLSQMEMYSRRLYEYCQEDTRGFYSRTSWLTKPLAALVNYKHLLWLGKWPVMENFHQAITEVFDENFSMRLDSPQFGDIPKAISIYSQINDLDIIESVCCHKTGGLKLSNVSPLFEQPFNIPHPFRSGDLSQNRWSTVNILPPAVKILKELEALAERRQEQAATGSFVVDGAPLIPLAGTTPFLGYLTSVHTLGRRGTNLKKVRVAVPFYIVLPNDPFVQEGISIVTTQVLLPEFEDVNLSQWRIADAVVALTEVPPFKIFDEGPGPTKERWIRIIEVKEDIASFGNFTPRSDIPPHWALLIATVIL